MDFGPKEKMIIVAALHRFRQELTREMDDDPIDEDEKSDTIMDIMLIDTVIARFEHEQ